MSTSLRDGWTSNGALPLLEPNALPLLEPNALPLLEPNALPLLEPNAPPLLEPNGRPRGFWTFFAGGVSLCDASGAKNG
jgi:hypothetical protein